MSYLPRWCQLQSIGECLHGEDGGDLVHEGSCFAGVGGVGAQLGELCLEAGVGGDVDVGGEGHCVWRECWRREWRIKEIE